MKNKQKWIDLLKHLSELEKDIKLLRKEVSKRLQETAHERDGAGRHHKRTEI